MAIVGASENKLKYIGSSTDTKPTIGILPKTEFFETDTREEFTYSGSAWAEDKEEK